MSVLRGGESPPENDSRPPFPPIPPRNTWPGAYCRVSIREDGFDYQIDREALEREVLGTDDPASPRVAARQARWEKHLQSLTGRLDRLQQRTRQGELHGKAAIGVRVGKVINKYKMAKHFVLKITDNSFGFAINCPIRHRLENRVAAFQPLLAEMPFGLAPYAVHC